MQTTRHDTHHSGVTALPSVLTLSYFFLILFRIHLSIPLNWRLLVSQGSISNLYVTYHGRANWIHLRLL